MEFKKDIPTEDLIKLIHQLPDADKQLLKSEIEADLRKSKRKRKTVRKADFLKGLVKTMSKDFDEPLEDMKDYM